MTDSQVEAALDVVYEKLLANYPDCPAAKTARRWVEASVNFDGSWSYDNDESGYRIDQWNWTAERLIGGYYTYYSSFSGETATQSFADPGRYRIELEVVDNEYQTDYDYCYVYVIDVVIDTPSSFPAYVAVGTNLALGCTPLGATGGTYSWTKVSGPGAVTFSPSATAEDPTFSANHAGDYTVQVAYSKGGATCSDTSGTIRVSASPVAILHYSASTYIGRGETVYFDGSGSFDPDGGGGGTFRGIKKFQWDWDNNGTYDYEENPGIGITSHSFTTGGTKTVTMRVTDNDAAEGGPPDKSATDSVTFQVCSKPHVATFWKKTSWEDPDGVLVFIYQWLPTYGIVGDLDGIVGEIVEYPDGDPYQWPAPWNFATYNPTMRSRQASEGLGQDTHGTGNFVQPYEPNSFSASQEYAFHCNQCMPSGVGMNLLGSHSISRQVYWVGPPASTWRYKIEKTGTSAEKDLP